MTLSQSDVEYAFRLILGREPESKNTVEHFMTRCGSLEDLRTILINSPEFAATTGNQFGRPDMAIVDNRTNQVVDFGATTQQLQDLWAQVGRSWESLGQDQPFHSVVTLDEFSPEKIDANAAEFWETGVHDTNKILDICKSCGIDLTPLNVALEYGCGVGRASVYLSSLFKTVHALDVSRHHLDIARQRAEQLHLDNIDFRLVNPSSFEELPQFDFFYSRLVLQHNPPPVIAFILTGLLQNLTPGGAGVFQVPVYMAGYRFGTAQYLKSTPPDLDMHCLPQSEVFDLVARAGCTICEVREDGDVGKFGEWVSNTIAVRKTL